MLGRRPRHRRCGCWSPVAIIGRIGLGFILPSLNLGAMRGLGWR